ncbi:hypothetical protein ACP2W0_14370 [Pseudobacillus badius]|uniref:hypothetical protein n=1 Tax=Bacillus badius TaxID=1455 RepID=UPI0007B0B578|nr:hypothetical protein [Bacillus badius]KZN98476.1 hypothetical protein A4244_09180 [Bacillus badius]MED0666132.1 hypothetical protein [Bacillus badius]OCS83174.1 hypothetical protein A6M11_09190 [Bacillus badius]OVE51550.1 hypothetical protein B1A98_10915 [Bacillus badius]TDW02791.1 hypothetical protein B0G66_10566 [Bacillus badius]
MYYQLLVYTHIVSAVASIGPFFVLLAVMKKMRAAGAEAQRAYIHVFTVSVRVVKHAGHVLVASGILLLIDGPWPWMTSWVVMTVIIMFSSVFFLARAFSPTLRRFEAPGVNKQVLMDKLHRSVWIYIFLLLLMLWFMTVKPNVW